MFLKSLEILFVTKDDQSRSEHNIGMQHIPNVKVKSFQFVHSDIFMIEHWK
jgi:hypothetical protein